MTAILALIQALFAIVFAALTEFVKMVFRAAALALALFFGSIMFIIWILQR